MNDRHLIGTHVFNIHFSNLEQAETEQDGGLTDFIKIRLLKIVNEVFSECCPDQSTISLDTLEINLGTIPSQGYRDEMAYRLQRELSKLLREKITLLPQGASGRERKLNSTQNLLEILRCFLETGRLLQRVSSVADPLESCLRTLLDNDAEALPSLLTTLKQPRAAIQRLVRQFSADLVNRIHHLAVPGKAAHHRELARLFAEVAEVGTPTTNENEQRFRRMIRQALFTNRLAPLRRDWSQLIRKLPQLLYGELLTHGQQAEVRRHLAQTFPDPMFADLIRLLEPTENIFIEEIVFRPALPDKTEERAGTDESGEKQCLREFTLTYLLTERGSRFNKKAYLASLLRRMAAHDNIQANALLNSICTALAAVPTQTTIQQEILLLLTEMQHSNELDTASPHPPDTSRKKEQQETDRENRFNALLKQAFYEPLPQALHEQWHVLFKQHAALLHRELFRHGQAALVRRRIAVEFTNPMFVDLLRLLEPGEAPFLEDIVFHPLLNAEKEGITDKPGSNERLREFTLAYLLTERGSRFNKKTYLSSLVTRMAAHDNLKTTELIQYLSASLAALHKQSSPMQRELLDLLSELDKDGIQQLPGQGPKATALLRRQEVSEVSGVSEWVFKIINRERGLTTQEAQQFALRLHELRQQHPTLLERLFTECSDDALTRFFTTAPRHSVLALISTLIQLRSLKNTEGNTEFLKAVEQFAGQSTSPRTYYCLLIEKLRAKKNIDFEEILRESSQRKTYTKEETTLESKPKKKPAQESSSATQHPDHPDHPALARLMALLRQRGVRKELILATENYAAKALSIDIFCTLILRCLEEDLPIDFEKILTQSSQATESPETADTPEKNIQQKEPSDTTRSVTEPTTQDEEPGIPAIHPELTRLLALLRQRGVRKELLLATENYAAKALSIDIFCTLILRCLEEDLPIDFEKILIQSSQVAERSEKGMQQKEPSDTTRSATEPTTQDEELHIPETIAGFRLSKAEKALARLLIKKSLSISEQRELAALICTMLQKSPPRLRFLLESDLTSTEEAASRLAAALPESQLAHIFILLRPRDYPQMQEQADRIAQACLIGPFGMTAATVNRLKQLFLSRYFLVPHFGQEEFPLAFIRFLQVELNKQDRCSFLQQLHQEITQQKPHQAPNAEADSLDMLLRQEIEKITTKTKTISKDKPKRKKTAAPIETALKENRYDELPAELFAEEMYIENGGMVLVATYMHRLFKMLGLLEQSAFKNTEAAERAVHLLQYLVEERCDRPEYLLVLNKIFCGVAPELPLIREIEITKQEKQAIDGLLAAVIQHWGALGNTLVPGLREAFLQRGGYLRLQNDTWHLQVEAKTYDMLLDRLPWSFALIKMPWMEHALHVQWRLTTG